MTLFEPTLIVERLIVTRRGRIALDLKFHRGLNIISGENSAGKTTIVRFIAYGLGAENIHFNQTALLCDETYVEVKANDVPLTLRRPVSTTGLQPMSIFWGPYDQASVT